MNVIGIEEQVLQPGAGRPHVVLLGAGASLAAVPDGDRRAAVVAARHERGSQVRCEYCGAVSPQICACPSRAGCGDAGACAKGEVEDRRRGPRPIAMAEALRARRARCRMQRGRQAWSC